MKQLLPFLCSSLCRFVSAIHHNVEQESYLSFGSSIPTEEIKMDCLKSHNHCINTVIFPGSMAYPTYTIDRYQNSVKFSLIFIPYKSSCGSFTCTSAPSMIPALLYVNTSGKASRFCINFHGNACDVGQISLCAEKEGRAYNAHYLLVEYPRFGIADGHPNEDTLNSVARSVFDFVVSEFKISPSEIILLGRSIGTGPAVQLASELQAQKTPPAALILQSPYSSIRDVTYDLLGCVNYFLLDRWQSWRKLIGPESDPSVIRSPVLFIHADGDRIISCNHSILMHEYRSKCGLRSELFIQKSDNIFVKGHNYFDYDRDVVIPSADFIMRHVNHSTLPNNSSNGGPETYSRVIALSKEHIRLLSAVPPQFEGTYTQAKEMEFIGSKSVFKSPKCTWDVYAGWGCCPCVFCTECCVACNLNVAQSAAQLLPGCAPVFSYQHLRPANDPHKGTLWNVFFRPADFKKHIREDDAASSAGLRQQRHVFHQQQYSRSLLRNNSSSMNSSATTNPLLAGAQLGDKPEQSSANSSSYAASGTRRSSGDYNGSFISDIACPGSPSTAALMEAAQEEPSSPTSSSSPLQLDYVPG